MRSLSHKALASISAAAVFAGLTLPSGAARAGDDKAACLDAYVQAQKLHQEVKLRASMNELATCSRETCPSVIRAECQKWATDWEAAMPTVVFSVKGPDGVEVTDVKITVDDEVLVTEVKGTAVAVDPGSHRFVFERGGSAPLEASFVIHEGEKRRLLEVSLAAPIVAPPEPPAQQPPPKETPVQPPPSRPVPVSVFVAGGIGVAALGGFAFFALSGQSDKSDLDQCKPFCSEDAIDANKRKFLVADVFLGVGIVSLGVATYLYLTRGEERPARARVDLKPRVGGGVVTWGGAF